MVRVTDKADKLIISIEGELDSLNAEDVFNEIEQALKSNDNDLILDFERLEYISSAGLQVVLMCAKDRNSKNRKVYIYKPQSSVDEIINIAGFYNFIEKTDKM